MGKEMIAETFLKYLHQWGYSQSLISALLQKCIKDLQKCYSKFIHDIADLSAVLTRKPEVNFVICSIALKCRHQWA